MAIIDDNGMKGVDSITISGREYTQHAEGRMRERHLVPTIVNYVIANPDEEYEIQPSDRNGHVVKCFLKRGIADVNPDGGGIGQRIIHVRKPGEKRDYKDVLVMVDNSGVVRTTVVLNNRSLEKLMAKRVKKISAVASAAI
jgi:hypothetical protein